jgi:exonuclease III
VLNEITGNTTQYNLGTSRRGTAIVARSGINLANGTRLPSGRAIAARFQDLWLINVYAPSGTARKQERETFYSSELPNFLTDASHHIILGDFNCILKQGDATGTLLFSRALATLIRGLNLQDAWQRSADRPVYTHYSVAGATRIDRIYDTRDLISRKLGIETPPHSRIIPLCAYA